MSASRDSHFDDARPAANVVSIGGDLRRYPVPVTVSQVLQSEFTSSSSSSSSKSSPPFLCNSDRLYFDDYIPALSDDEELQAGQIYFVLPASKLQYRLSASDMAALAVKASLALESQNKSSSGRKQKKARISPLLVEVDRREKEANTNSINLKTYNSGYSSNNSDKKRPRASSSGLGIGIGGARSGSLMKLQRYSSRRAKLAVRSFRIRLTTIYEGSVPVFN